MKHQGRPCYDVDDMWIDDGFVRRMKDGGMTADDVRRALPIMIEPLHGTVKSLPGDVPGVMRLTAPEGVTTKPDWFVDIIDEDRFWAVHAPLKDLLGALEPVSRNDLADLAEKVGKLTGDLARLAEMVRMLKEDRQCCSR